MKSALIISFALHIAVGVAWFNLVKIHRVRFIPREVYTVSLVTPQPKPKPAVQKVEPEPTPPKPEPAQTEEKEEMPAPPERPKPKPAKKTPKKKAVPSTDIKKTSELPDTAAAPDENAEQVSTGDIMLDGQDFPFAYYLATMKRKIAAYWEVPGTGATDAKYCRVYFRVAENGSIGSPSIETSSGNFLFDQAALRAVVQASPLPPLPEGFADNYLGVHFSFAYERE